MSHFQILHISDLHVRDDETESFDRSVVLGPLIDRVRKDVKDNSFRPEIVVVTGDVAFKGVAAEYGLAKAFLDDLLEALDLGHKKLFIVPGNHDVNRDEYRPGDVPQYKDMRALNDELGNKKWRKDLLKGMGNYFDFVETAYPHLETLEDRLIPFVSCFKADCGKKIGLVGLNSSWMCRKSSDKEEIAVGEYQVRTAMKVLKAKGPVDLQINLLHHPLSWLWAKDRVICETHFQDTVLLCGHLHEPDGGYFHSLNSRFHQFQAGGAYLGTRSNWPNRFQYITFDWGEKTIRLDFRRFAKNRRIWTLDADTGDEGSKVFPVFSAVPEKTKGPGFTAEPLPGPLPQTYVRWINTNYANMDADRLYGKGQAFPLSLPEIFIALYAYDPSRRPSKGKKGPGEEEGDKPVDIEKLIGGNDVLLIEGQAGSGKTTLLKHVAYSLTQEDRPGFRIEGLEEFLPVLVFLKDLKDYFSGRSRGGAVRAKAEDILAWYFAERQGGCIDVATLRPFVAAGKTLFLLDGLDEISPRERDAVVNAFSDLVVKNGGNKLVFSGRPHGLDGAVVNKYGKKRVRILSLDMAQVKEFILKWFMYLYPGSGGVGRKNANAMLGEIKAHRATEALLDNPLMLTAICILYHDGKELPGQRAELYKKFIDNLLYRRFDEPEVVHDYLKQLAFEMHEKGVRTVDRTFAVTVLARVYARRAEETDKVYEKRLSATFDHIEPRCGLLRFENGQYTFWHLTFQEFLAADYLVDNRPDPTRAIDPYVDDERYKEVVELYVGYLSMEHKKTANVVVENMVSAADAHPYRRWRLAALAFLDIHEKRREQPVGKKIIDRLLSVIALPVEAEILADAGESIGWLGDPRDLKAFIEIQGGTYELEGLGKVTLQPFDMAKYPVTNQWFAEFVAAGGYETPEYWTEQGRKWLVKTQAHHPRLWDKRKWTCPNAPVVGVNWYEAAAFARWCTERDGGAVYNLPDENQWQAAAAGFDARTCAWGNKWGKDRCNTGEAKLERTSPVGVFKLGDTPEGISDLAGNVWEWTRSNYKSKDKMVDFDLEGKQWPVLRGGSWLDNQEFARCAFRLWDLPGVWILAIGFRCVRISK